MWPFWMPTKEGFLRSETSLIQTIGRAARNAEGLVIMYADVVTDSMDRAITETERRRAIQMAYNKNTASCQKPSSRPLRTASRSAIKRRTPS